MESIVKVMILSKPIRNKKREKLGEKPLLILGNGPSIKELLVDSQLAKDKIFMAVNYFPDTDKYAIFKPEYLILQAPEFWINNVREIYKEKRKVLYQNIISKTEWPLTIFVPSQYKKSSMLQNILESNNYVTVHFFNDTPIEGFTTIKYFLFGRTLGMPRPHNVLIPALMMGVELGYKQIYLAGVEHSWLPTIRVNEKNEALIGQKHFYETTAVKPKVMYKEGRRVRKLDEILEKFMLTFRGYFEIREYAEFRGAKIYNTTKDSFIDAFERV